MTPEQIAAVDEAFDAVMTAFQRRGLSAGMMLVLAALMIRSVATANEVSPMCTLADVVRYMADYDAQERASS
jgi:hypothetical protein